MDTPTIIDSLNGVSSTRSPPNSSYSPSVARKTPPFLPTSSPNTTIESSRRISSARVVRTLSMNVMTAIGLALALERAPRPTVADEPGAGPQRIVHARRRRVGVYVLLGGGWIGVGL